MTDHETREKDVKTFLQDHPDFLVQHPDILEALHLHHQSGDAISLIERQVNRLREQNQELSKQLNQLIHVASENELLMSRLHELTLELLPIHDLEGFFQRLCERLLNDFNTDYLHIILFDCKFDFDPAIPVRCMNKDDAELQAFQGHLENATTICGRLSKTKLSFLFGNRAPDIQSTALVPLGQEGTHGLLVIGSKDSARFYPGMGTLFLDLLGDVICSRISNLEPEARLRSA